MVVRCSNGAAFLVLEPEPSIRTGIRVDIYDGDDPATLLAVLPDTWDRNWLDPLRGTGSGGFTVAANNPILAANPDLLAYGNIARFSLDEVYRFAIQIEHKDRTQVKAGGDVERTLKISGRGVLSKLEDTQLYPAGGLAGTPERAFVDVTPGELMGTVMAEGSARGGLVGIQEDYTDALDSNNVPYDNTLTVEERAGTSGLRVAERIQELAADIYMTPGAALRIVNTRGVDRSQQLPNAGPVILRPADNLEELTRNEDGTIRNALLIETPAGFLERVEGASAAEHGRREAFLSLGNMSDTDAVDRAANSVFQHSAQPAAEIGAAVSDVDGARPYVDWGIGDWVLAPNEDDELERLRVRALSVSEDDEGQPVFTPELATITEELQIRLERWLAAMSKGTIGGTAGTIAEPVKAPVEVVEAIDAGLGDHLAAQPHHDELSDLADTDTTGLADDDILRYNAAGFAWEPEALQLDALDDVDLATTAPTDGQVLKYDAASGLWLPAADLDSGAGGGGAKLLGEHRLASDAAFLEVPAIAGTSTDLLVVVKARSNRASTTDGYEIQVGNGTIDTGTNYRSWRIYDGSGSGQNHYDGVAEWLLEGGALGNSGPAGLYGTLEFTILDYANPADFRHAQGIARHIRDATGFIRMDLFGIWENASAAIDVIRITPQVGTLWKAGSRLSVYEAG